MDGWKQLDAADISCAMDDVRIRQFGDMRIFMADQRQRTWHTKAIIGLKVD